MSEIPHLRSLFHAAAARAHDFLVATLLATAAPCLAQSPSTPSLPPRAAAPPTAQASGGPLALAIQRLPEVRAAPQVTAEPVSPAPAETLEQAWATALVVDQQLSAKHCDVSAADYAVKAVRAQRWPVLGADSSYTLRSDEPAFRFGLPGIPTSVDTFPYMQRENFALRAQVGVPLYTSGRIANSIAAAEAETASAALQVEEFVNDLKLQVAEEFVAVLRAQRVVSVAESTVKSLEAHARDVEMLYHHDQVPRNDMLAAQVSLSNARQSGIQARNRLDACRAAYNRRLGRPLTAPVCIAELSLPQGSEDVESLTTRAVTARPALARLGAQAEAIRRQADSLAAKNGLQVDARGEYAFEENRFRTPDGIAAAGLGVSWNLFDGGRYRYEAMALRQRAEALIRLQADLRSRIALEARQAWLDVQETRRRLEVTREAIARAEENLRVVRKRYAVGAAISTEVLEAETLRTQAYDNHDNATYDAVLAALRLQHASGDLIR